MPFYIRDLSICDFLYLGQVMEPILCGYQGTALFYFLENIMINYEEKKKPQS
jgi:hypothetical protein